jgi:hypothetical protein
MSANITLQDILNQTYFCHPEQDLLTELRFNDVIPQSRYVNTIRVPPSEHLNRVLYEHSERERKEILTRYAHRLEKSLASIIYDFRIDYRTGRSHITLVTQEHNRPSRSHPMQRKCGLWLSAQFSSTYHYRSRLSTLSSCRCLLRPLKPSQQTSDSREGQQGQPDPTPNREQRRQRQPVERLIEMMTTEISQGASSDVEGEMLCIQAICPGNLLDEMQDPIMACKATSDPDTMYLH